ncbi:Two-component transcriptional response regulator, LuxR family [hydrothermal vent metagenome]|uniref:Two-component transcriptional response regulator, LuxR family n=1 Tax=hydrothermal vent metagenome TaxID=652676 RepID=A0A3B1C9S6_9ZZZZ
MKSISPSQLILIVEDSDIDFETTIRAFKKTHMANPVQRCEDGEDALDYLFQRNQYSDADKCPRPELILLDLNLPGTDGREVLEEIKQDPKLKSIPVIVLTTSSDDKDIQKCYRAGANSYIQKPVDLQGFFTAIQRLKDFWFEVVLFPKKEEFSQ